MIGKKPNSKEKKIYISRSHQFVNESRAYALFLSLGLSQGEKLLYAVPDEKLKF